MRALIGLDPSDFEKDSVSAAPQLDTVEVNSVEIEVVERTPLKPTLHEELATVSEVSAVRAWRRPIRTGT